MKSLSILSVLPPEPGAPKYRDKERLEESARHFSTLWSSAVAAVGTNEWLVADAEGNLVVLRRNIGGVTDDDRKRLEVVSEGRLGEAVNQIVPVSLSSSTDQDGLPSTAKSDSDTVEATKLSGPVVFPRAFIATVEGGVYLMGTISSGYQDMLIRLQSALAARVQSPGYMPWANWRAFKTEVRQAKEPYRFVDGELVECALGMDDGVFNDIIQELNVGGTAKGRQWEAEEVRGLVEGLRRLH
jgi:DNA damage-binding protein 1